MSTTKIQIPEDEVTYTLDVQPEDIPVRGNALASGDDEEDRRAEDEIIERLDRGDTWAWASVLVKAEWNGFTGTAGLGCCSYRDEADFKAEGGYYEGLKTEAFDDLYGTVASALNRALPALADDGF